jgi:hypothetical protein
MIGTRELVAIPQRKIHASIAARREIISVMTCARARVSLLRSPHDPGIASSALQSAFGKLRRFLHVSGIEASTPMFYQADGGAEGYLGEFIIPLAQAIRPPVARIVTAWLDGRPGRAVRLSVSESESVALSTEEAERFLRRAQRLRERAVAYAQPEDDEFAA